ncbi:MAG: metallophosphoesterase family protein [Cytophagales bacterium]|nr:metallophosphoesterase family protein [Armatimonadota bacterium]
MEQEKQATATLSPPALLRRVGVIGDVHGHSSLLDAALQFLSPRTDLDALVCTGDIPGDARHGDTDCCCRLLEEHRVFVVRGNHDRWAVENEHERVLLGLSDQWPLSKDSIAYLKSLPATLEFDTPLGPLLVCHGTGEDDQTGVYPGDTRAVLESNDPLHALYGEGRIRVMIAGHTHQRMVRTLDHLHIVNAAAVACERDGSLSMRVSPGTVLRHKNPCLAIVDFETRRVQYYNIARSKLTVTEAESYLL